MNVSRSVSSKTIAGAVCAAACFLAPSGAGAATLRGTVVGQPQAAGGSTVVPVLLSAASDRATGASLAKVVVPASGVRASTGPIAPLALRIGDRVSATVTKITRRSHTRRLRVTRRGLTPTFRTTQSRRTALAAKVKRAQGAVAQLQRDPTSVLDPKHPAASNDELRGQLLSIRTDLNVLIDDVRTTGEALDATVAMITAVAPADPARARALARRQAPTLDALSTDAATARTTVVALDGAVGKLDETINDVGVPSAAPLPIETVTAASNVLAAVFDLLRGSGGG